MVGTDNISLKHINALLTRLVSLSYPIILVVMAHLVYHFTVV